MFENVRLLDKRMQTLHDKLILETFAEAGIKFDDMAALALVCKVVIGEHKEETLFYKNQAIITFFPVLINTERLQTTVTDTLTQSYFKHGMLEVSICEHYDLPEPCQTEKLEDSQPKLKDWQ